MFGRRWNFAQQTIDNLRDEVRWLRERVDRMSRTIIQRPTPEGYEKWPGIASFPETGEPYSGTPAAVDTTTAFPPIVEAAITKMSEGNLDLARDLEAFARTELATNTSGDDVASAILRGAELPGI